MKHAKAKVIDRFLFNFQIDQKVSTVTGVNRERANRLEYMQYTNAICAINNTQSKLSCKGHCGNWVILYNDSGARPMQ